MNPTLPLGPTSTPNVLLVDDEESNLYLLTDALEGLGARLVPAGSGAAALQRLDEQDFALILLDVRMPLMDGFETAARARLRTRSASTPIIFVSGDSSSEFMRRGYDVGAVDYVVKPLDPAVVRSKVAVFLDLQRAKEEGRRHADVVWQAEDAELRRRNGDVARADSRVREMQVLDAERLRVALEMIAEPVIVTDPGGLVCVVSGGAESLVRFSPAACLGRPVAEVLRIRDRETGCSVDLQAPGESRGVLALQHVPDQLVGFQTRRLQSGEGEPLGMVIVLRPLGPYSPNS